MQAIRVVISQLIPISSATSYLRTHLLHFLACVPLLHRHLAEKRHQSAGSCVSCACCLSVWLRFQRLPRTFSSDTSLLSLSPARFHRICSTACCVSSFYISNKSNYIEWPATLTNFMCIFKGCSVLRTTHLIPINCPHYLRSFFS